MATAHGHEDVVQPNKVREDDEEKIEAAFSPMKSESKILGIRQQ